MFDFMFIKSRIAPYFDADGAAGGGGTEPSADPVPTDPPKEPDKPQTKPTEPNYGELMKTDKAFQEWFKSETQSLVDKKVTQATETAVKNALEKQKRINDESLSRAERLQAMSDAEKVKFLEKELEDAKNFNARQKEIEELRVKTTSMFAESEIPTVFLEIFDFDTATAEDIQAKVKMLAVYEYFPKGEFKSSVEAAARAMFDDKHKQKDPEGSLPKQTTPEKELTKRLEEARKNKNTQEIIRIKKEAHAAGIILV